VSGSDHLRQDQRTVTRASPQDFSVLPRIFKEISQFLISRKLFASLMAIHLPMVLRYFVELWPRQHYQFYPFAIVAFIVLFASRKSEQPERWNWLTKTFIALDFVCLLAGCFLFSPWFFAVGLFCCLTAWSLASQDADIIDRCST
jgi:hypothetical protein